MGNSVLGFGADIKTKAELDENRIMAEVIPQDLVRYGLIPELVGRMPVITALENLNEEQLVKILTEPKNALVKQYKSLFMMDRAELEFDDDALKAVAKLALEKSTGARGLRAIMENALTPIMYTIPSDYAIDKVRITGGCILDGEEPIIERDPDKISEDKKIKPAGAKSV